MAPRSNRFASQGEFRPRHLDGHCGRKDAHGRATKICMNKKTIVQGTACVLDDDTENKKLPGLYNLLDENHEMDGRREGGGGHIRECLKSATGRASRSVDSCRRTIQPVCLLPGLINGIIFPLTSLFFCASFLRLAGKTFSVARRLSTFFHPL